MARTDQRARVILTSLSAVATVLSVALLCPTAVTAAGIVGSGTPESCTETALDTALTGGGTVTFNCGAEPVTITVTGTKAIGADTTIDGGTLVTISGGHSVLVFGVNAGIKFTVENLTIANGGGAIANAGSLIVTNGTFSGNSAIGSNLFGGAHGAAISNNQGNSVTITNSTFSGNSVHGCSRYGDCGIGGAIFSDGGTLTVTKSTFSGNGADGAGGAIFNQDGRLAITNSTFSGNGADGGGGAIFNTGTLTVANSTFSDNSSGGAIASVGAATLTNTIVANSSGGNCAGTITDGGHNLDDGTTCGFSTANGSLSNTDPKLDPAGLVNNGGPTQTIAVEPDSPAINGGDPAVCANPPVNGVDQRRFVRPGAGYSACSIGAYEYNSPGPPPGKVVGTGAPETCTEAALDAALAGGGTVTFDCGSAAGITVTSTKTISTDTTIDGGSLITINGSSITISGGNNVSVFSVDAGVKFTVHNLRIANGHQVQNSTGGGGAIRNDGSLTVAYCTFDANSADCAGGVCNNYVVLGGAVYNLGSLTVTNSTFWGNTAPNDGAISNGGTLIVINSTFFGNSALLGRAGAIGNDLSGSITVTNSTFAKNLAPGSGGAIANAGSLVVTNSTFSGNSSNGGVISSVGAVTLINTIVANTTAGGNCSGTITDGGHNLDDGTSCGFSTANGSLSSTDPDLYPTDDVTNNGGPTQTIALEGRSPAINAGDEGVCAGAPVNNLDQRGYVRPGMGYTNCSIGAFEYNSSGPGSTPTPTATPTTTPTPCTPLPPPTLNFSLSVEPVRLVVGNPVLLSFTVSGNGGLPQYTLSGAEPILQGDTSPVSTNQLGTVIYHLVAAQAGTATLVLGVNYEAAFGCAEHPIFQFVNATSPPFSVTVACPGDCNGDGAVTIDELITMVNVTLGIADVSHCMTGDVNQDGQIAVSEIITAVKSALSGC